MRLLGQTNIQLNVEREPLLIKEEPEKSGLGPDADIVDATQSIAQAQNELGMKWKEAPVLSEYIWYIFALYLLIIFKN